MSLEVYWGSGSPFAWRVLLALEVKQIPYESKRLNFSDEDLKSAEFLTISPRGKVPAIRDGEFTLSESIAILRYLEDKQPQPVLFGDSATERGQIWCSIMECVSYLEPLVIGFARPVFMNQLAGKRNSVIAARGQIEKELSRLENTLNDSEYLVNNRLSAADITFYTPLKFVARVAAKENTAEISASLRDIAQHYPNISAWCKRIETIPGYDRAYPPHWKE